jgi:hypothetical protein
MLDIQANHFALELTEARVHALREDAQKAQFTPRLRLPRLPAFTLRAQQPACCPA